MPKKQKSGLYRSKVRIGVDAEGKEIVKYISGKTKRELEQARQEVERYYIHGTGTEADQLFGAYALEWFKARKDPFVSPSTQQSYRWMLTAHLIPTFGDRNLRAIRANELQAWINGFSGSSKSTITQALSAVRGIFSAAMSDRVIASDPTSHLVRPFAAPPADKRALTEQERAIVKSVMRAHPDGLYLAVLYYTGMRPGEVRGLMWGDVDFDTGLIHVQRDIDYKRKGDQVGELKTKAANRYVPISQELRELLRANQGLPNAFMFVGSTSGKPLSQTTAARTWIRLMVACGMALPVESDTSYGADDIRGQYAPAISPHAMRHNFITMCWESGMDVLLTMKIVGHADYQTTMNIYTHLSQAHLEKAKQKIDEVFENKKVAKKLHKQDDHSE